jgi:hypothetical protein
LAYRGAISCLASRVRCQSKNLAGEEAESIKILRHLPDRIHLAPSSWATFEAEDYAGVELCAAGRGVGSEDPSGQRPGLFRHTPQGILHGAPEAYRAEFQKKREPSQRRTGTSVDTYRPLIPTPEFTKMAG